jgi:uncharacterized protein YpuA (DUF1002 family)
LTYEKKEVINDLYNAALVTAGVAGLSMVSKKAFGESLGAPMTLKGALKLTAGIAGSAALVGYAKARDTSRTVLISEVKKILSTVQLEQSGRRVDNTELSGSLSRVVV